MSPLQPAGTSIWLFLVVLLATSVAQENNETTTTTTTDSDDGMIDCPLCGDPSFSPQDPFSVFATGDAAATVLSCQTAFDMGPVRLPAQNCTFWQKRGSTICQCASQSTTTTNDCKLCADGAFLPNPYLEGRPGVTCAELQIQARRDDPEHCVVWQQTQGVYCGCNNTDSVENGEEVCRLCGSDNPDLIRPLDMVTAISRANEKDETSATMSCGEVEFQANLPENQGQCNEYLTLYGSQCCRTLPPPTVAPSEAPTLADLDGAIPGFRLQRLHVVSTVVGVVAIVLWGLA